MKLVAGFSDIFFDFLSFFLSCELTFFVFSIHIAFKKQLLNSHPKRKIIFAQKRCICDKVLITLSIFACKVYEKTFEISGNEGS